MISFEPSWAQGHTLCFYSTPEMRRLAEIGAEASYHAVVTEELPFSDTVLADGDFHDALWDANGNPFNGFAHWAPDAQGRLEASSIDRETRGKPPTHDAVYIEYLRAAERIEGSVPGITAAFRNFQCNLAQSRHLNMEGGFHVQEVDGIPDPDVVSGQSNEVRDEIQDAENVEEEMARAVRRAELKASRQEGFLGKLLSACGKAGGLRR